MSITTWLALPVYWITHHHLLTFQYECHLFQKCDPVVDNEASVRHRLMAFHIDVVKKTKYDHLQTLVSICNAGVSSRYNNAQCQVHAYFQGYRQAFHDLGYNGMTCLIGSQVNTFHDVHCLIRIYTPWQNDWLWRELHQTQVANLDLVHFA